MCEACPEMVNHNDSKEMDAALRRAYDRIDRLAEALREANHARELLGSGLAQEKACNVPVNPDFESAYAVLERSAALASRVGTEETTEPLTTREDIERDTWTPEKQREIAKRVGTEETDR